MEGLQIGRVQHKEKGIKLLKMHVSGFSIDGCTGPSYRDISLRLLFSYCIEKDIKHHSKYMVVNGQLFITNILISVNNLSLL